MATDYENIKFLVQLYPNQHWYESDPKRTKREIRERDKLVEERDRLFHHFEWGDGEQSVYPVGVLSPEQQAFIEKWKAAGEIAHVVSLPQGYKAFPVTNPWRWLVYKDGSSETLPLPWKYRR